MIYSYRRGAQPLLQYAKDIKFLNRIIKFKPGINIIVGKNGSGKSALLTGLKKLFLAEQQGYTKINGASDIGRIYDLSEKVFSDKVEHNGFSIVCNKVYDTGSFDDDNFLSSVNSIMFQKSSSTGEASMYHLSLMNSNLSKLKPVNEIVEEFKKRVSSHWFQKVDKWLEWFNDGIVEDTRIVTIVLDEPTTGFDFYSKIEFWDSIFKVRYPAQFIIATHDMIPLFMKDVNVIETENGYANTVKKHMDSIR
jgi:predicted ATPase